MAEPKVSILIPVGPGHEHLYVKALYSALMQHGPEIEIIVINDTEQALSVPENVILVEGRKIGPSAARNDGAKISRGEALVCLDADDQLCPGAIKALWAAYQETGGDIIYGYVIRSDNMEVHASPEQYCGENLKETALYKPKRMPTHLVPRTAFFAVEGFDETIVLWEDVDLEIKLDIAGYCATRIEYPIYFYNFETGLRRISDKADEVKQLIKIKYDDYFKGVKKMGCTSCGGKTVPRYTPNAVQDTNMSSLFNTKVLELEFIGTDPSVRTYPGPVTGKHYRFGATKVERTRKIRVGFEDGQVHPDDAKEMARLSDRNSGKQFRLNVIGDKTPTQAQGRTAPTKKPDLKIEMEKSDADVLSNAIWAGMSIDRFTVRELRDAVDNVPEATLTRWLKEEQEADNPRVTVIDILETKIGVDDVESD